MGLSWGRSNGELYKVENEETLEEGGSYGKKSKKMEADHEDDEDEDEDDMKEGSHDDEDEEDGFTQEDINKAAFELREFACASAGCDMDSVVNAMFEIIALGKEGLEPTKE